MSMRENYPGICRAIHQENGGHGEAVNAGLRNATGVYYKVVDSDDWVNEEAYMEVLDTLRKFVHDNVTLDMLITNFVYEKQGAKHKKVMNYNMALPKRQLIDLERCKRLPPGTVYPDAFSHLPCGNASELRVGTAKAYVLRG